MSNKDVKKILIETNQFCNLNCEYCFYNDFGRSNNYLGLSDIKTICNKYLNAREFYLTGGECTLNNQFIDIFDYLSNIGKVTLFTNGLNFEVMDRCIINKIMSNIKKIIITYDSISLEYSLRRNSERNVFNSIKKLLSIDNSKIEIKICLNKFNYSDFESTLLKLIEIGVKHFSINYIKNITSCTKNFELSIEEIKNTFLIVNKYKRFFNQNNINLIKKSYKCNFKNKVSCIAGKKFIYIDCFGKEFYCPSSCKMLSDQKETNCFGKHCINLWEMFI